MALTIHPSPSALMDDTTITEWSKIPAAIISDELNRKGAMDSAINPLQLNSGFAAQALTVQCMVGDNSALHYALTVAWPGCVLVVDAGGYTDTALWGGILTLAAKARGVRAIVIDGAVRDAAELRSAGISVYCRGIVPNGPHKGFGGEINGPITCAGQRIDSGDLIVADDDGVAVIRPDQQPGLLERCQKRINNEASVIERIEAGEFTVDIFKFPSPEEFPR
jgi:4-hydroxy-4-methyl-2-oxoglutarate aldolase